MHAFGRSGVAVAALLLGVACGGDDGADGGRPSVVVTTNILGDVVAGIVGDAAEVTTIMPVGASPHDFQASAQQAAAMRDADLLVINGAGFEEGLLDVIEGAEADGVPVHEAIAAVDTLELGDEPADEEGAAHGHTGADPHFFTDPVRMADAVDGIVEALAAEVDGIDDEALQSSADAYRAELEQLDADIESTLAGIDEARRVLVTNHEVFGYFADRYGFEVVGTIIPSGSTSEGASAGALAGLVDVIAARGVPAIFADTSSPAELAETLADEVGAVEVVELFSESLGEPGSGGATYVEMVRTNAERIAAALA